MAFNYSDNVVLWTYRLKSAGTNPSRSELEEWDTNLHGKYEGRLIQHLGEFHLPTDQQTKSIVLMLALLTKEPSIPKKVRSACAYFIYIRDRGWDAPV